MHDEQEIDRRTRAPGRRLVRILRNVAAAVLVFASLLAGAAWLGWKAIERHPEEVLHWLGGDAGQRVSIAAIETQWEGMDPRIGLRGVTLFDSRAGRGERPLAHFESLEVEVDIWASLHSRAFRPAAVTVSGASLMLIRRPDGSLDLQGIQARSDEAQEPDALARLFLEHAQVSVHSSRLLWVDQSGAGDQLAIREVDMRLHSEGERRQVVLSGTIEHPGSGHVDVELDLEGDLLTPQWSGDARLNARDLDLEVANAVLGTASKMGIQGQATLELSGRWQEGSMVSTRGLFHLRDTAFELDEGLAFVPQAAGSVELHPGRGTIVFESGTLDWDWPERFDHLLSFSALSGKAAWHREAGTLRMTLDEVAFENPHLAGSVEGSVAWPEGNPGPVLEVTGRIERADLSHLSRYLPSSTLESGLGKWLRRALHGGRIEEAEVWIEGALRDWPFDGQAGSIGAHARISGVELRYAPGWPSIEDLAADMRFGGERVDFDLSGGRVAGAEIVRARVRIPRAGDGVTTLDIEGEISGSTEQAADFLRNSPLAPRFDKVLDTLQARGPADLALQLAIPLAKAPKQVSGRLEVRDNRSELPNFDQGLEGVTGVFSFEGPTLDAEGVEALYLGRPVTLRVLPSVLDSQLRIEAWGTTTREHLARHLRNVAVLPPAEAEPPQWLSRLDGEAHWRSLLEMERPAAGSGTFASLRIDSDLQGARFDLPPPLAKAAPDSVGLEIEIEFGPRGAQSLRARYGETLSSVFALRDGAGGGPLMERGMVRFGGNEAELPGDEVLVLSGSLPGLSLEEWSGLLRAEPESDSGAAAPSPASLPKRVNLQVDELEAFGIPLGTTRIDAQADSSSSWTASIVGANVLGEIRIPAGSEPILVHMDRLIVPGPDAPDEAGEAPSPASLRSPGALPAFRFTCAECKLGDRELGTVDIFAQPDPLGTRVQSFYMRGEDYEARGSGAWLDVDGTPRSSVDAEVHSDDLGRLLGTFGHIGGESISGATDMLLSASWPGSPFDFDLRYLDGVLHFRASEGRLTQVRRGATGRFFGLLMVPSLPRRLALDFRDLFQEGLAYELMEGSFAIGSGDAYTNNFVIESPTATIELAGRTGLIEEDYDHLLTLTPKLSESIALLPIWLGERLLNTRIFDRVFAHRYSIQGPWSAPRIEPAPIEGQQTKRQ